MKKAKGLGANTRGFLLSTTLLWVLTGCAGYVDHPRVVRAYYPVAPPPPEVVYVEPPPAPVEVSDASLGIAIRAESDFYEPLSAYGRWEVVGSYGRCWIPGRVEANWRPYCQGYWQRTEDGWYWVSDEPWAWATYHYGRWDVSPEFGWYWVPQTQWAPAWVSWHTGGGYIGWAPLSPSARFARGGSVEIDRRAISPRAYVFVEERHFQEPVRPSTVVVNNTTIINNTVNITNVKVVNNTVINEGPATGAIEKSSGRRIQALAVRDLRHKEEARVVVKQMPAAPIAERPRGVPVRSQAEPVAPTSPFAHAPAQVEKPRNLSSESARPGPRVNEPQPAKTRPVFTDVHLDPPARPSVRSEVGTANSHSAINKDSTRKNGANQVTKPEKAARPGNKKKQDEPKQKPDGTETINPNTADQGHENKAKDSGSR